MLNIALIGCGRIGAMHAGLIAAHDLSRLAAVYDPVDAARDGLAARHGAAAVASADEIMADSAIDAVFIASATPTHADLIVRAAKAGKAVFCEKPIDLDIARALECREAVRRCDVPIQIGFNRRFDPGNAALRAAMAAGDVGNPMQILITSRDPAPPSADYVAACGGMLRDMTIHDFDLARFLLGDDEPTEIYARAGALIDPSVAGRFGDVDCAMIVMRSASGRQVFINNSRQAPYGYDQRVEVLGDKGMLQNTNHTEHGLTRFGSEGTAMAMPYKHFFIERYRRAFDGQLDSFLDAVASGRPPQVSLDDGIKALMLAEAAYESLEKHRTALVGEI